MLNGQITSRVNSEILKQFRDIATEMDKKPQQLIRELIVAVVDNRIKIAPIDHGHYSNIYSR